MTRRLDELDSLRGLAALSVVLFHFKAIWLENAVPDWSSLHKRIIDLLLQPYTAGHEAVVLFFILSGFVLSIPAIESRAQSYLVFVVRRIFRIYFPYAAALVVALLGSMFFYGNAAESRGLGDLHPSPADWSSFAQHVMFLGQFNTDRYDSPIWSLVYEMRISLVFPILCAWVLKLRPGRSLLWAGCVSVALMAMRIQMRLPAGYLAVIDTLHYAALFVVGIYLARERGRIAERFNGFSRRRKMEIAAVSALLYLFGSTLWLQAGYKLTGIAVNDSADWITALGAAGMIAVCLNSGWCSSVLHWAPVRALGRMSYSVYLLHVVVMLTLVHLLYGRLTLWMIFALCLVVTLAASWAFYRFVEIPSMNVGRRLSVSL